MAGVTFKVEGLDRLIADLRNLDRTTQKKVSGAVRDNADRWVRGAKRDAPKDVSFLSGQIGANKVSELEYDVVSNAKYAAAMEFGTKKYFSAPAELQSVAAEFKGRPTGSFRDLLLNISGWVRRKAIVSKAGKFQSKGRKGLQGRNVLSVAYPIALKIARDGIKPQPYFFKQRKEVEPQFRKDIENIINDLKL